MPKTYDEVDVLREGPLTKIFNQKTLSAAALGVILVIAVLLSPFIFETNSAGWYAVKQAAGRGTLSAHMKPGMFVQGFGDVTFYKAADTLHFAKDGRGPVSVRFNDGATSDVVVNVRYELPANPEKLLEIHSKFRNYDALVRETVEQVVREAVLLSAAMMSTEESYTTKRAEFSQLAQDQVINGIYLTEAEQLEVKDKRTGESAAKTIVRIQRTKDGQPLRKEAVLDDYGIRITQFVVQEIDYSEGVDAMIQSKQTALQQVVSAKANAEKAIQDRLTAEEVGRKDVAVAKAAAEVKKQEAVTQAEQELEVARLERQAAEQNKAKLIAEGEGEAAKRRLAMQADGALTQKLDAVVKINAAWADAYSKNPNPTPQIVFGGSEKAGATSNAATQMMEMLMIKSAKDLQLSMPARSAPAVATKDEE